jgi:hypothetical protein
LSIVLVAREPNAAQEAAEAAVDDRALGTLLGYPDCCIDAYCSRRASFARGFDPVFRAGPGPWPWWSNVLLGAFGLLALSHFPCRPDCGHSRDIALRQWRELLAYDERFARYSREELGSLVLWQPDLGVAAAWEEVPEGGGRRRWSALGAVSPGLRPLARTGGLRLAGDQLVDAEGHVLGPVLWVDHRGPDDLAD